MLLLTAVLVLICNWSECKKLSKCGQRKIFLGGIGLLHDELCMDSFSNDFFFFRNGLKSPPRSPGNLQNVNSVIFSTTGIKNSR